MPILALPSSYIDDKAASALPSVVFAILDGEQDADHLSSLAAADLAARDFIYTLSIMCCPADIDKPTRLNWALTSDELYHATRATKEVGLKAWVEGETAIEIADREDWKEIAKDLLHRDWLAHIAAGFILRWVVSRWRDRTTKSDASLTVAAKVIEEWCQKQRIKGGRSQHVIRNLWPKYKSVSHLWAAFYIMQDAKIDFHTPDGFQQFLSTAQWLLETGAKIVPKGRRPGEAVLSLEQAWQVPASYVLRARMRATGEDASIVAVWNNELNAHDLRLLSRPPFMDKPV
jgi:hypothetical protein